jgi:hypothetical protein
MQDHELHQVDLRPDPTGRALQGERTEHPRTARTLELGGVGDVVNV